MDTKTLFERFENTQVKFGHTALEVARLNGLLIDAKSTLARCKAESDMRIRAEAKEQGSKVTEDAVEKAVLMVPAVISAEKEYNALSGQLFSAKTEFEIASSELSMLRNFVRLVTGGSDEPEMKILLP